MVALIGAALVVASAALPLAQEIILAAGGGILLAAGMVFLVLRQLRDYRHNSEG